VRLWAEGCALAHPQVLDGSHALRDAGIAPSGKGHGAHGSGGDPVLGDSVKRSLLSALALALLLATAAVPAVLAADDGAPAADPTPAVEPTAQPDPTPTPFDGNGEITIDPTFITSTPTPAATPVGEVLGATGRPDATPPATDTIMAVTAPSTSLHVLLLLAIAGSVLALLAARLPAARRR